jgi:hypothetical protein
LRPRGRRRGRFHPGRVYQVEAIDRETRRLVRLWPGEADALRGRTRDGFLLCPVMQDDGTVCGRPYGTTVSGNGARRDHFRHARGEAVEHAAAARESQWHVLAKQTIEEWAHRRLGAGSVVIGVEGSPVRAGAHGRTPDVRIERPGRPIVAIEVCSTSPATGLDWRLRHHDYRRQGIVDVWLLADTGGYGDINVQPGMGGRPDRVVVRPKGVALEMLRNGVVPCGSTCPTTSPEATRRQHGCPL